MWSEKLETLGKENTTNGSTTAAGRVRVSCIEGGSHFWAQSSTMAGQMLDVVQDWLDER